MSVHGTTRPAAAELAGDGRVRHPGIARVRHRLVRVLRMAGLLAGMALVLWLALGRLLRPWYATWGAAGDEARAALPGDDLVPHARAQSTRAITIHAPPEAVWPWLVQMGVDRAGLYTHTWVENGLLHLGVTNADRIHPEWQDLAAGDIIAYTPASYPGGRTGPYVAALEPGRALLLCNATVGEPCTGTMQIVLRPLPDGSTRLIVRGRAGADAPLLQKAIDTVLEPGYFYMERGMLRGIKERAERASHGR